MKPLRNYLLASLLAALLACPATQAATRPVISQSEVAFAPDPAALQLVLKAIQSARRSIHVAAYVFTSKPVAQALLAAQHAGIEVAVVADRKENSGRYSATRFLADQQLPVRLNARYAIFHHKFMIIDAMHVQTGSFNYSAAAAGKNAENVLVVWNAPELAARYEQQWQRLWQEADTLADATRSD
ncbi:endonuclease [Aquitalea sp. FJL05]|uniref:phospholipase D family nuclease n=1 Tax=Aquitalea TaxID=407217 RepID=UPI000F5B725B|nr:MULTISPECIES: phospholipase D family protein [Aquitalea]RQO68271.1 endonuclease [Aquitalea sp. FJL05]